MKRSAYNWEHFRDVLSKSEKQRSKNTLRTYAYSLKWLSDRIDGFEDDKYPSPETVIDYMDKNSIKPSRRMGSYTAMKVLHNCKGEKSCSDKYGLPLLECKRGIDAQMEKQERSDKESKNWVPFSDLKKFAACVRAKAYKLDKNVLWSKDDYAIAQLAFILTYHLKFPIRRDLATVTWGSEETPNHLNEKTHSITYNVHKCVRWSGPVTQTLSRDMWKLFSLLRRQHKLRSINSGYILLNRYWRRMSPNGYSTWLKRETKAIPGCDKKTVGVLAIRHSVITHKLRNERSIKDRQKFASECMHSTKQNQLYRKL